MSDTVLGWRRLGKTRPCGKASSRIGKQLKSTAIRKRLLIDQKERLDPAPEAPAKRVMTSQRRLFRPSIAFRRKTLEKRDQSIQMTP